jgi:hypothetical protein
MTRAEEYRAHARYCACVARFIGGDRAKHEFEKQARGWLKMAERAENHKRRAKARPKTVN